MKNKGVGVVPDDCFRSFSSVILPKDFQFDFDS